MNKRKFSDYFRKSDESLNKRLLLGNGNNRCNILSDSIPTSLMTQSDYFGSTSYQNQENYLRERTDRRNHDIEIDHFLHHQRGIPKNPSFRLAPGPPQVRKNPPIYDAPVISNVPSIATKPKSLPDDQPQRINTGTKSIQNSLRILSGGVDKTLQWMKSFGHLHILYEVIGKVNSVQQKSESGETVFTLSELELGSLLKVSFFDIDRDMQTISPESLVKVVGALRGKNKLQAFIVMPTILEEFPGIQHISYICDCAIKELKV